MTATSVTPPPLSGWKLLRVLDVDTFSDDDDWAGGTPTIPDGALQMRHLFVCPGTDTPPSGIQLAAVITESDGTHLAAAGTFNAEVVEVFEDTNGKTYVIGHSAPGAITIGGAPSAVANVAGPTTFAVRVDTLAGATAGKKVRLFWRETA